jgi:hypothetical protein
MANQTLDGDGGGEITIADGDGIDKCDGNGAWIVWSENGGELVIADKKDGNGSLELHGFSSIVIKNKKDGDGTLIVGEDCGTVSIGEVNGSGPTFLRNTGPKRIGRKDGDGAVSFKGQPPIIRSKNGRGTVKREH